MKISSNENPTIINNLMFSCLSTYSMITAIKLDIFSFLSKCPKDINNIAEHLNVKIEKITPLLYSLVAIKLLKVEDDFFSNSNEAEIFLVKGKSTYRGGFVSNLISDIVNTEITIKTGIPNSKKDFNKLESVNLEKLLRGMHFASVKTGITLSEKINLNNSENIIDIGGGTGGLTIGLAQKYSKCNFTIIELPNIVPISNKIISENSFEHSIKAVSCDIVNEIPEGIYDTAFMMNFIQVISPEEAEKSLKNIYKSLKPGAKLYVIGRMLDNSRISPEKSVLFNIVFLNWYDEGQAYTIDDYTKWLHNSKFEIIEIENNMQPDGNGMIVVQKPL